MFLCCYLPASLRFYVSLICYIIVLQNIREKHCISIICEWVKIYRNVWNKYYNKLFSKLHYHISIYIYSNHWFLCFCTGFLSLQKKFRVSTKNRHFWKGTLLKCHEGMNVCKSKHDFRLSDSIAEALFLQTMLSCVTVSAASFCTVTASFLKKEYIW